MAILEVKDLKVHYMTRKGPAQAVDSISFSVEKNKTVGLIGESGCGKTTTARAIMKFVKEPGKIVSGEIIFKDKDVLKMSDAELRAIRGSELTIVRQEAQNALNPVMNIGDQIAEVILEHEKIDKKKRGKELKNSLI